jgi:hypothetical protein
MLLDLFVDRAERLGVETEYIDQPAKIFAKHFR